MFFLEAGNIIVDNATMFAIVNDKGEIRRDELLADGEISLALRGLYFEKGGHKVVLDPGPGSWIPAYFPGYRFSTLRDARNIIEKKGIEAAAVTDVFLTHLHFDHCAGIFLEENDLLVPAFPGATIHISNLQVEEMENPSPAEKDSFLPGFIRLIRKYYDIALFDGNDLPGFLDHIILSNGHTRGMMIPVFSSNGERYIYVSDLVPTVLNMKTSVVSGYDTDPYMLYREKLSFFSEYGGKGYHLIFFHEGDEDQRQITLEAFSGGE